MFKQRPTSKFSLRQPYVSKEIGVESKEIHQLNWARGYYLDLASDSHN